MHPAASWHVGSTAPTETPLQSYFGPWARRSTSNPLPWRSTRAGRPTARRPDDADDPACGALLNRRHAQRSDALGAVALRTGRGVARRRAHDRRTGAHRGGGGRDDIRGANRGREPLRGAEPRPRHSAHGTRSRQLAADAAPCTQERLLGQRLARPQVTIDVPRDHTTTGGGVAPSCAESFSARADLRTFVDRSREDA